MLYNNAKAGLVYDVDEQIFAADPEHAHEPRTRPDPGARHLSGKGVAPGTPTSLPFAP